MPKLGFSLISIEPKFERLGFEEGKHSPETYEKCTRGHRWNVGFHFVGVGLDLSDIGLTEGLEEFCFFCLRDLLREKCGRVKAGEK